MNQLIKAVALSAMTAALMTSTPVVAQVAAPSGSAMAAAQVPVAKLDNPQQLTGAGVIDASSKPIGKVAGVKTGSNGRAERVKVALMTPDGMGRVASIKAEKLSFDKAKGVVVADLSPAQVTQLAATASSMGPGGSTAGAAPGGSGGAGGGGKAN
jgi:hypothetical protein